MTPVVRTLASRMTCAGCGAEAAEDPAAGKYPFQCPRAHPGDDIDHVLTRILDPASVRFPADRSANPFVTYRRLVHSYDVARGAGMSDEDYVALVRRLDDEVARVDGAGFRVTPFGRHAALSDRLGCAAGGVWIKDETGNVSGSHKARHLMGIMIYLQVLDALGLTPFPAPRLAIASCGNAALAAAVVARAAGRALDVFIPPDAPQTTVERLQALGAHTVVCEREPGTHGDPCYLRFQERVARGAIPFCCQGTANGMTIEGGETLGDEMITALGDTKLDAVLIQVGGGALASAVIQAFSDARALGACSRLPRFYTVQTRGAFPLKRAYDRLLARGGSLQIGTPEAERGAGLRTGPSACGAGLQTCLQYAAIHRHEFMWPWEEEPRSIARGILDDETYDWLAVVKGMLQSGGRPVVVDETELADAYALAHSATIIDVDHTGSAGLAGAVQLIRDGTIHPADKVAVIFSGARRH